MINLITRPQTGFFSELKRLEDISYAVLLRLKSGKTRSPRPPPIDAHASSYHSFTLALDQTATHVYYVLLHFDIEIRKVHKFRVSSIPS